MQPNVSISAEIPAAPATIYALIADYRNGHPRILPRKHFAGGLEVLEGGYGAGTVVRARLRIPGAVLPFVTRVSEPEPGRVLAETNVETGMLTTFTVDPLEERRSRVTISTTVARGGPAGWVERLITVTLLPKIYRDELQQLAEVAASL